MYLRYVVALLSTADPTATPSTETLMRAGPLQLSLLPRTTIAPEPETVVVATLALDHRAACVPVDGIGLPFAVWMDPFCTAN